MAGAQKVATGRSFYRCELLDCEDAIAGYMEAAAEEGAAGVLDAMAVAAVARLINQTAAASGVDRLRLCAALDGGPALNEADASKLAMAVPMPVSSVSPVAVG
jgi:DNA-binding phage protein